MEKNKCVVCAKSAQYLCGQCEKQKYCGNVCQKKDWSKHIENCNLTFNFIEGGGNKRTQEDIKEEEKEYFLNNVKNFIKENQIDKIRQGIKFKFLTLARLNELIAFCVSDQMARVLVNAGANVYTWIGDGKIALDEMVKHFPIREFLQEAKEATPNLVKLLLAELEEEGIRPQGYPATMVWLFEDIKSKYMSTVEKLDWNIVRHMIYNGIFPANGVTDVVDPVYVEHLFFRRYDRNTLDFWFGITPEILVDSIKSFKYKTLAQMKRDAQTSPKSFALLLFMPQMVFKESKRARTTMRDFGAIPLAQIVSIKPAQENGYIPITRYAKGMSKSLFYSRNSSKQYCGTFYYYEPESTTFLKYSRALTAKDKVYAAAKLGVTIREKNIVKFPEEFETNLNLNTDNNFLLTPKEFTVLYPLYKKDDYESLIEVEKAQDRVFYTAPSFGYYASQDDLDQPICDAARAQGYDVVFLTHMVGSRQIVFEVLDTRPRNESFANLYFLEEK